MDYGERHMHAPGARTLSLLGFFHPPMAAMRVRECVCLRAAQLRVRGARREAVWAPQPLLCCDFEWRESRACGAWRQGQCLSLALSGGAGRSVWAHSQACADAMCAMCVSLVS